MLLEGLINYIKRNAKNLIGWKTDKKIIVFSVDDYGNVRVNSKASRERMNKEGLREYNRFDSYDALETREDLEALYEVLSSVEDKHGRHAVFTTFAMPCNINFEKIAESAFEQFHCEHLPETFRKLSDQQPEAYRGTWDLLNEGIEKKLMVPQFHGREHLNLKLFQEKLAAQDHEVLTALKNRSYTSISSNRYSTISPMAAFDFWEIEENKEFEKIIREGLDAFEKVYGYRATHFNAPGGREHSYIHKVLKENGIQYIDTPMIKHEHQGRGKYSLKYNYTGKHNKHGQTFIVRNVLFEPTDDRVEDWLKYTLDQIEAAFRWNRPAVISSHRVNFCGHIDEENRKQGLGTLQQLLEKIMYRWPEVEFMSADELGGLIGSE